MLSEPIYPGSGNHTIQNDRTRRQGRDDLDSFFNEDWPEPGLMEEEGEIHASYVFRPFQTRGTHGLIIIKK